MKKGEQKVTKKGYKKRAVQHSATLKAAMLLVSAQHMAHITRSQRLRYRQVAYIDDMAIRPVTLRSKNLKVTECHKQKEATKKKCFDFDNLCIWHGRAMNGLKSRVTRLL